MRGEIDEQLAGPGKRTCTDVARSITRAHPEVILYPKDVQNSISDENDRESLNGRTATQQLMHDLEHYPGAIFFKKHEAGRDDGPIACLFWTYSWAVSQWKGHPEVLSFDNTYKTNKFNMPLLQVTGITSSWTTFSVGWALLDGETEASFAWAIGQIQKVAPVSESRRLTSPS